MISPLLANLYLHELDATWEAEYRHLGRLVRYADNLVVLCRTASQAREHGLYRLLGTIRYPADVHAA